jgi:membrane protease YdiL (CAAX protease family)
MKSLSQRTEGRSAHAFRPSWAFWPALLILASLVYVNHDYLTDHLLNILYWRLIPLIGKERALWQSPLILRHAHWPTIHAGWLPVNFSDPIFWCNHILYWGVGAFIEEIVDHGLLYTALRSRLKAPTAILIISLFFTLDHFHYDYHPGPFPSRFIVTLAVGIILAWMREWSGNIWCPLSAHWFNDFSSAWRIWTWTY